MWLVVGAGLTGSTIARELAEAGYYVTVFERRSYIAGTAADYEIGDGLRIQRFGPHIFHTKSERIWKYVQRYSDWDPCKYRVAAHIDGKEVPLPLGFKGIRQICDDSEETIEALVRRFGRSAKVSIAHLKREKDPLLKALYRRAWGKLFYGYSLKHWGIDPNSLSDSVTARLPIVVGDQETYFDDTFQAVPRKGYTAFVNNLLDHPKITVHLGTEYRGEASSRLIYTGAVDEIFGCFLGALPYRSVVFETWIGPKTEAQRAATINYPNEHPYTRVTDLTRVMGQESPHTAFVREYPVSYERGRNDPLYPVLTPASKRLRDQYAAVARKRGVLSCGRLGEYRYYNMDQAVASALRLAEALKGADP